MKKLLNNKNVGTLILKAVIMLAIAYAWLFVCGIVFEKLLKLYTSFTIYFTFFSFLLLVIAAIVLIILMIVIFTKKNKKTV